MAPSSKIFKSNRALGYVSNHIPLVTRYIRLRNENLVVTCVGRAFHTYSCSGLSLLSVSNLHSDEITCIGADVYHIYTASNGLIQAWRRGTELKHSYIGHESPVHIIMPFGPFLLSIDETNFLKIWDIKSEEVQLELTFDISTFQITTMLHPATYINKILLGSKQGSMQLWNINSVKQIFQFKGWSSGITVLEQAPAVDVVGIGLENGRIILHNLKFNETVMEFVQDWGLVTSLSFRTDGNPVMVSGSLSGHVVMWNLAEGKAMTQMVNAHSNSVTGLQCLPNEPLMVTSSSDNSLKVWIFDLPDGGARILHSREGHGAPPTFVRFHGSNGENILSSGGDSSLRIFSTITEKLNKSLGKASYNRKLSKKKRAGEGAYLIMPRIVEFTCEVTREKEWDNIAAVHLGRPTVTTWSYDKLRMGNHKLLPERFSSKSKEKLDAFATCICLTSCGNFVVIGYSSGHVDRFNIQSGIHRGSYGHPSAHIKPVRGVATDNLNSMLVTGSSDVSIKFWNFKTPGSAAIAKLDMGESVIFFRSHHDSSLLAVALENFSISLLDLDTRTVVRKFESHRGQITDATFSPDARWLITSSMDCLIRTWDVPSSQLVDCFQVATVCTSLCLSPVGDLLATTHVDYLGVYLWSNRTLYSHVSLSQVSDKLDIPLLELPSTQGESDDLDENGQKEPEPQFKSADQISDDLITMSSLASSRWKNLLDIDIVKRRNKPKEPLKPPKAAPFFLPTVPSLTLTFDLSKDEPKGKIQSKVIHRNRFQNLSAFGRLLKGNGKRSEFEPVIAHLKTLGPSTIDFEISLLAPENGGTTELMLLFMKMIEFMMKSNKDFELAQAYLGLFLKSHGETITSEPQLRDQLPVLQKHQRECWELLQNKLMYSLCVVQTIKGM